MRRKLFIGMGWLMTLLMIFPMTGDCQVAFTRQHSSSQVSQSQDLQSALQRLFQPYLATAQLNLSLCGESGLCQILAEEYINKYFLVNQQCSRVLAEDRVLCSQLQNDCSKVSKDLKDVCMVYMNADIAKARTIGLTKEWPLIEDFIVDVALTKGFQDNNIESCVKVIREHIDISKVQYYACDIVFAQNPQNKIDEIIATDFTEDEEEKGEEGGEEESEEIYGDSEQDFIEYNFEEDEEEQDIFDDTIEWEEATEALQEE